MDRQENPLLSIGINIIIPIIILMRLSSEEMLGPVFALILALAFPLGYGIVFFIARRKANLFSALGFASILLTGGIGLLRLDAQWIAIKEAAIPFVVGVAVLVSMRTGSPIVRMLVYNERIIDIPRVEEALERRGAMRVFRKRLDLTSYLLAGSFFVSALLNYVLARMIVVSEAGTPAFNEELGRLAALSFPVIVVPMVIIMLVAVFMLLASITRLTGLSWEEVFVHDQSKSKE